MLAGGSAAVTPWLPRGYRGGQRYIYFGRGDDNVFGFYLIVRAIAEPFVIDMSDPATCRQDCGGTAPRRRSRRALWPGRVAAALMVWVIVRRHATA